MSTENRLSLQMNAKSCILALSKNDKEAEEVCGNLLRSIPLVCPSYVSQSFTPFFTLDQMGVYENRIYSFFKYVCEEKYALMLAVLINVFEGRSSTLARPEIIYLVDKQIPLAGTEKLYEAVKTVYPCFDETQGFK